MTPVWVNSRSWWWTGKPGVLQSMELQRVRHNWAIELNWTEATHLAEEICEAVSFLEGISEQNGVEFELNSKADPGESCFCRLLQRILVALDTVLSFGSLSSSSLKIKSLPSSVQQCEDSWDKIREGTSLSVPFPHRAGDELFLLNKQSIGL